MRQKHYQGDIPPGCKVCVNRKKNGLGTKWERAEFRRRKSNIPVPYNNPQIQFVKVAMTNRCNMSCAMCSTEYSSKSANVERSFAQKNSFRSYNSKWEEPLEISKIL